MRNAVSLLVVLVAAVVVDAAHSVTTGNGGRIVFENFTTRTGSTDVFVMNAHGGGITDVTASSAAEDTDPAISPSGKQVAFVSDRGDGNLNAVYVMNADGSGVRKLGGGGTEQESPAWSPDGKRIAFSRCSHEQEGGGQCTSGQIAIIRPDGKGLEILTKPLATSAVDADPTWSPNGKTIVFQRRAGFGDVTLWSIGFDGRGLKRLLDDHSQLDHNPSFSPNGKQLVYATDTDGSEALYLIDARGGGVHKLLDEFRTRDPGRQGNGSESPAFSPSGTRVVYVAAGQLWVVGLDGRHPLQLTHGGGDHPDWGPR